MRASIFVIAILVAGLSFAQSYFDPAGNQTRRLPTTIQNIDGSVTANPSWSRLYDAGWRTATQVQYTVVVTNQISPEMQLTIETYRQIIDSLFGEGAHLSTNITEDAVASALIGNTNVSLPVLTALKVVKNELREFTPNHFSTLPYGKTEIITTNTYTRMEAAE